ncbi:hypothetical protein KKG58_05000 [Patescibacteria group bacterium]|nr:hypothetical protein [Patescibacteria group bacterium]
MRKKNIFPLAIFFVAILLFIVSVYILITNEKNPVIGRYGKPYGEARWSSDSLQACFYFIDEGRADTFKCVFSAYPDVPDHWDKIRADFLKYYHSGEKGEKLAVYGTEDVETQIFKVKAWAQLGKL